MSYRRCRRCCSAMFAVVAVPVFAVVAVPAGGDTFRALVGVAVVDLFFAAAVPAGGARRGHVCVGIAGVESLQRGTSRKHIRSCEMMRHGK